MRTNIAQLLSSSPNWSVRRHSSREMRRAIPLPPKLIYDYGGGSIHWPKVHCTKGQDSRSVRGMRRYRSCGTLVHFVADILIPRLLKIVFWLRDLDGSHRSWARGGRCVVSFTL